MTLEIDDAGWGDLVGGCFILLRRVETGISYGEEIPVELFQQTVFKQKLYLTRAWEIVSAGLKVLSVYRLEPIRVCTGYILSEVREKLASENYFVTPTRIVGETQNLVEKAYLESLKVLGINDLSAEAGGGRFRPLLRWVHEDLERRERFVKTGWKSWEVKWRWIKTP